MDRWPRITIVTPSYNQSRFIAETVESVLAQGYPNVEHIIMDGGSTDGTLDILQRYPHLKVISERDRGQADAINKGFALATGDIWAFLNSDDTYLPGALHKAAQEIDPLRERHVVMGRCVFTDTQGRPTGIEHPSHFETHYRVLEVWKGHTIPQPSVFWTPEAWRTCGPMIENLGASWVDYDLFCRFSRRYTFHFIDQILSTYRLQIDSKTQSSTEAHRLEESIQISRRYWGSPLSLMYWRLTFSLAQYRFNRVGRARHLYWKAQEARRQNQIPQAIFYSAIVGLLAPEVAWNVAVYPALRKHAKGKYKRLLDRLSNRHSYSSPRTDAYMNFTNLWEDGWAGPRLVISRETTTESSQLLIQGQAELRYLKEPLILRFCVDGQEVGNRRVNQNGKFEISLDLPALLQPGAHQIEIRANTWFVPDRFAHNGDYRPLAWRATGKSAIELGAGNARRSV